MKYFTVEYGMPSAIMYDAEGVITGVIPGVDHIGGLNKVMDDALSSKVIDVINGRKPVSMLKLDYAYMTDFAARVLNIVSLVPRGSTMTYGEVARQAGTRAYRAVGNVCRKNRFPLIIPCHRIVSASGPGGYAYGTDLKKLLLEFERRTNGQR